MTVQFARDDTDIVAFQGGLSVNGLVGYRKAGTLSACLNYEPDLNGGYSRIPGIERFNGKPSPSDASYQAVKATMTAVPALGTPLTIGAATAVFLAFLGTDCLVVTAVVGIIPNATAIVGTGATGATGNGSEPDFLLTSMIDAQLTADAADVARAGIAPPAGTGGIRGGASLAGVRYCWRDSAVAGVMFKATSTGWQAVAMGEEVAFSNANASVGEGDVLTQGGVTSTIRRVIVESGSLASGTNTGRLVISGRAGGNYSAAVATSTGGGTITLGAAQVAQAFPKGGHYKTFNHNFRGEGEDRMYGVNGVGRAFEFDGTTLAFINAGGGANDTPDLALHHLERLVLADDSSILWSVPGVPLSFDGIFNAVEIAAGDKITGLYSLQDQTLAVITRKQTRSLAGTPSAGMQFKTIAAQAGGVPDGSVQAADVFALRQSGLASFAATQQFGEFSEVDSSQMFLPVAIQAARFAAATVSLRARRQVRFFGSDGSVLCCMTSGAKVLAATQLQYPVSPTCAWVEYDEATGAERQWIGAADGMVYECNVGSTFDGADIEAFAALNFLNSKSPRVKKSYRECLVDIVSRGYASINATAELSSGDPTRSDLQLSDISVAGGGGRWDVALWDAFVFDAAATTTPRVTVRGSGTNLSLIFYSKSRIDLGHTLQAATLRYSKRKLARGG